ncbi:hypothetical protein [Mycolicibacterium sp. XJ1819]
MERVQPGLMGHSLIGIGSGFEFIAAALHFAAQPASGFGDGQQVVIALYRSVSYRVGGVKQWHAQTFPTSPNYLRHISD